MALPASVQFIGRQALHAWAKTGRASGYLYNAVCRYGHMLGSGEYTVPLAWGARMKLRLNDVVEQKIYFFRVYEPAETYFVQKLLRPGDTMIDAGANVGYYTLLAAALVGETGRVHSFEPVPANFGRLSNNVEMSGFTNRVRLNRAALWYEPGELELSLASEDSTNQGAFSVGAVGSSKAASAKAPAMRLDDYVEQAGIKSLRLIKMDIEGAEFAALKGAVKTLERFRPAMLLEVNPSAMAGTGSDVNDLHELLRGFGYRSFMPGVDAAASSYVDLWNDLPQGNLLLSVEDLPQSITKGWSVRELSRTFLAAPVGAPLSAGARS
jgi:FkbM family methyltransferase